MELLPRFNFEYDQLEARGHELQGRVRAMYKRECICICHLGRGGLQVVGCCSRTRQTNTGISFALHIG